MTTTTNSIYSTELFCYNHRKTGGSWETETYFISLFSLSLLLFTFFSLSPFHAICLFLSSKDKQTIINLNLNQPEQFCGQFSLFSPLWTRVSIPRNLTSKFLSKSKASAENIRSSILFRLHSKNRGKQAGKVWSSRLRFWRVQELKKIHGKWTK